MLESMTVPKRRYGESVRSRVRDAELHDMIKIVQADVMMLNAMLALLAKRARRREAETIWL